jgi:endo-1,4-beta-xylanase
VIAAASLAVAAPASAASLQRVASFGSNPSNLNMYVYVPDRVDPNPAILVAMHYCTGTAQAYFSGMAQEYVTGANQYGYVIVFPEATRSGQCFDVYSPEALRRNGGSDPVSIKSMIDYALTTYKGDPARVFATGASSGAMMTNVMLGLYPDVFAGGVAFMGVPFGCFATGSASSTWNSQCSGGQTNKTAQQWGDQVRQAYPGYTGSYPRFQAWHGSTDTTLSYNNFAEEIEQWTNLHGISQTPVLTDSPVSGWTRTRYGSAGVDAPVEGISVQGVGHNLPTSGMVAYAIAFLGLDS